MRIATLHVDSTSAGEPVLESLRRAGVYGARAYPFTQRSKAALVDNLSILFEQRRITISRHELWPEATSSKRSSTQSPTPGT